LGLIVGYSMERHLVNPEVRLFMAIGFCGGFSTFSTFTYETFELLRLGQYAYAGLNILGSLVVCLGALLAGLFLSKITW
jgi:CrcB protein